MLCLEITKSARSHSLSRTKGFKDGANAKEDRDLSVDPGEAMMQRNDSSHVIYEIR